MDYGPVGRLFGLVFDALDTSADGILVANIPPRDRSDAIRMRDGLHVIIKLVDQGNGRRNVELGDVLLRDAIKVHHKSAEAVAVGRDEQLLSALDLRHNLVLPVRQHTVGGSLERLGGREQRLVDRSVLGVIAREVLRGGLHVRRRNVEATAPDKDLVLSVFVNGRLLVEAGEAAVVALVELPRLDGRDPKAVRLLERVVASSDGALERGGVGDVEGEALLSEQSTALRGLLVALL
mmetsp:Transcript_58054/g.160489  ORF Transcript_58054/g.160489 Transcript_58054/m.160489 type:complete len:236 (-) Transcript_58054:104-811(-)